MVGCITRHAVWRRKEALGLISARLIAIWQHFPQIDYDQLILSTADSALLSHVAACCSLTGRRCQTIVSIWFWSRPRLSSLCSGTGLGSGSSPRSWRTPAPAGLYRQSTCRGNQSHAGTSVLKKIFARNEERRKCWWRLLTCRRYPAGWPAARWPALWRCPTSSRAAAPPPGISCSWVLRPGGWRRADPPLLTFGRECGGGSRPQRKYPAGDTNRTCVNEWSRSLFSPILCSP